MHQTPMIGDAVLCCLEAIGYYPSVLAYVQ